MFAPFKGKCHVCGRDETPLDIASDLISKEMVMKSLLRRARKQLNEWQIKYGENNPSWLPPGGEVKLLEDIEIALNNVQKMTNDFNEKCKIPKKLLNEPFDI